MSTSDQIYDIIFLLFISIVAFLPMKMTGYIAMLLILLFPFLAVILYSMLGYLSSTTWSTDPTVTEDVKYLRAIRRSSTFFITLSIISIIIPLFKRNIKSSATYKYISLYVIMILSYIFDRAIATDEGFNITISDPLRGITLAYDSLCSPSFMRFFFVLTIEIVLTVILSYFIVPLVPERFWFVRYLLGGLIIPFVIFSVVTGPLRFKWAYPNVKYSERISYISTYIICFTLVGLISYLTKSNLFLLCVLMFLAALLQFGGMSNAPADYSIIDEAVFPTYIGIPIATLTLIAALAFGRYEFKQNIDQPDHQRMHSSMKVKKRV